MSAAVPTIAADEAEVKAAELREEITEKEAWLVAAPALIEEAAADEARKSTKASQTFSYTKSLQKRKADVEAELPRLRGQLRAMEDVVAEHELLRAAARGEAIEIRAEEYDAEERAALRKLVAAFDVFDQTAGEWQEVRSRREAFRTENGLEYARESVLETVSRKGPPKTLPATFDAIYKAKYEAGTVGDPRHLDGWDAFVS